MMFATNATPQRPTVSKMSIHNLEAWADAIQKQPVVTNLNPEFQTTVAVFKLEGADVASYLQRRTSNDVLALAVGEGHANTFLDKKAYLQTVFSLHRVATETFYALVPNAVATAFEQEVLKFKIMETFTCVNETEHWQVMAEVVFQSSPQTTTVANNICTVPVANSTVSAYQIQQPFWIMGNTASNNYTSTVWLIPQSSPVASCIHVETANQLPLETFQLLQHLWGVPQWGTELSPQIQLPETGLEHWCVSYTKGCFLGQETVARVRTYGGVQQTLMGIKLTGLPNSQAIQLPCHILQDSKKIVTLTSGVWEETTQTYYALGYVGRAFRLPSGYHTEGCSINSPDNGDLSVCFEVILLPFEEVVGNSANTPLATTEKATRLHELAMTQFVENHTEEALHTLDTLLSQYPHFLPAYETKGVLLSRLSRFEEAITTMEQLLTKNDKHVMAYTNLSIFWLKLGDKDQAEHFKAKATSVAMGLKMAEAMAKKAATASNLPTHPTATDAATLQAHQQRLMEKITLFKHALEFSPTDALAYYGLGTTYLELHQFEAAATALQEAITLNPKHSQAYVLLAETYYTLHQFEAAAHVITTGITVASTRGDLQPLAQLKTLQAKVTPLCPNH